MCRQLAGVIALAVGLLFSFAALATPVVTLTSPTGSARFLPPAAITLTANAVDPTDTIARVDFYSGTHLIGTATTSPYSVRWTDVPTGAHPITATAVNSHDERATTVPVNIIVNTPPTATLTADVTAHSDLPGSSISLAANAADADGSIALVEFYDNGILFAATATAPHALVPRFRSPGIYHFTARAIDNLGGVASSNTISVTVAPSTAPAIPSGPGQVVITAPLESAVHFTPADIELEAAASAAGTPIARVDFYNEATLIGTATAAPYRVTWRNVPGGKYGIVAKATDSQGIVRTSNWIVFHVNDTRPVALTSPLNNASSLTAPASIALEAMVADNDGRMGTVEFLNGETVLATVTAPPYAARWEGVAKGSYTIRARATDRRGVVTLSAPVTVLVVDNAAPVARLTAPVNGATYATNAPIELAATATDTDGSVARVEFFDGGTLLGTVTQAPYTWRWSAATPGSHAVTARATDNQGAQSTSTAITVTVAVAANAPPTVSVVSPSKDARFAAPAAITLEAAANDSDGSVAQVAFYQGGTLLATVTAPPYRYIWTDVPAGTYAITARARDNLGAVTTSDEIGIIVSRANVPPTVSITAPSNDTIFAAPAGITINADAADSDGTITRVEFYNGTTLLGTSTAAPHSLVWNNVPLGIYSLTVKATDDAGVTTTSSAVNVTVGAVETITYLHNDFAGSPIAATDSNGVIVWKENYRPYGDRLGNDPAAANNRQWFHGKAVDAETGLSYFGARYYDATLGRFMGVDPVGFRESNIHSFNRYAYGNNNPYRFVDPDGREAELIAWITPLDMLNSRNRIVLEGGSGNGTGGVTTSGRSIFKETTPDAKVPVSGETKFTAAGRKAHQQEPLPSGFERDVVIPGTRLRMDGYNKETKEILELKPNNRRQIRRGEKQLEGYCKECNSSTLGPGHTTQPVQTYDPSKYLKEN